MLEGGNLPLVSLTETDIPVVFLALIEILPPALYGGTVMYANRAGKQFMHMHSQFRLSIRVGSFVSVMHLYESPGLLGISRRGCDPISQRVASD